MRDKLSGWINAIKPIAENIGKTVLGVFEDVGQLWPWASHRDEEVVIILFAEDDDTLDSSELTGGADPNDDTVEIDFTEDAPLRFDFQEALKGPNSAFIGNEDFDEEVFFPDSSVGLDPLASPRSSH